LRLRGAGGPVRRGRTGLLPWHTYLAGPTSWDARLTGVRAGAAARRVLAVLHQYPVLDAATLAHALGVSERASRTALNTLAGHQIVAPFHPHGGAVGRPRQWWVAEELVDLVTAWSR